ncbi:MAG: CpaF family protein [Anaerolineales bacterium]|nr:CpaF family protein [Anaerolineales bacterium]
MSTTTWPLTVDAYNPLAGQPHPARHPAEGALLAAQPYDLVKTQLRDRALAQFSAAELAEAKPDTLAWLAECAHELIAAARDQALSASAQPAFTQPAEAVVQALLNDVLGMGPIEALLRLPDVEDIAINGPTDIWYRRHGYWERSDATYPDAQSLLLTLNRAIVHTNRQAGPLTPIVDATLRSGHRMSIVTEPVAEPWPVATIRVHRDRGLSLEDLVAGGGQDRITPPSRKLPNYYAHDQGQGLFTGLVASFLHMAVVAGLNLLVVGATGVGKTTVLGALGRMIPTERRVIVIEDTRELRLRVRASEGGAAQNCVYFTTRAESLEGLAPIQQDALVRAALRQRPDALTVGEARGAEVFDLLKSMWTGHRNGLTSIHADSLEDVPNRIRMMLQEARFQTEVSDAAVALWIAKAFDLGIMLRMTETGRRYVEEIAEFTGGVEGHVPVRTGLFAYAPEARRLRCTGHQLHPTHEARLRGEGYSYGAILQAAAERGELG